MSRFTFVEMTARDYEEVLDLWRGAEGICLSDADSRENIAAYLKRNPGFSLVARLDGHLAGAVLCGHDSRRGYLHHLAVGAEFRRMGLGSELVRRCLEKLREVKIDRCHLFLVAGNLEGLSFWQANGWRIRDDLCMLSKDS